MDPDRRKATIVQVLEFPWSIENRKPSASTCRRASYDELTNRGLLNFDSFLQSFRSRTEASEPETRAASGPAMPANALPV